MRMDRTKGHARTHQQTAPNSPWLCCAVARATRVHRAELNKRGRARRATNHAGSARADTTSGPAPLLSPPGNRRSLFSGAKSLPRDANGRATTRRRPELTPRARRPPRSCTATANRDSNRPPNALRTLLARGNDLNYERLVAINLVLLLQSTFSSPRHHPTNLFW